MTSIVPKTGRIVGNLEVLGEWDILLADERTPDKTHALYKRNNEDVAHILYQLKREILNLRIETSLATQFPWQTLVTDATNLTEHTLNGVTAPRSKLTTKSSSPVEFDWPNPKRQDAPQIIVGVGSGVAEHAFLVNPEYNVTAFNVEYDGSGNLVLAKRPGICIPVQGEPTSLLFVGFVEDVAHKGNIKAVPVNLAYGTTIYLHQRMPGE